ncbi:hypothetical protein F4860DRAFT_492626 [Xylaria cubensis]|nr:hypothetical protein F4860DRAFT_492626 [Xylaria cubensis]
MNQDGESRPSPFKRLPVELLQMILGHVPDVPSLYAAVLSCSLFYRAFEGIETTITTQVLLNQIDVSVLPEAMMTFESTLLPDKSKPESSKAVDNFITRTLRQRPTPPRSWSLQKALPFGQLHFYVDAFAKKFVETTLTRVPFHQPQHPVTKQEICRIQRALYRFEICCNLYRANPNYGSASDIFLPDFAEYENEQLNCIYGFLARIIAPTFNDVAEHDIAWGASNIDLIDYVIPYYAQYFLSFGLETVHVIASAKTYKQRYRVLDAADLPGMRNFYFMSFGPKPFCDDPDSGPQNALEWAFIDENPRIASFQDYYQNTLRGWGYVMWDQVRLETVGIFEKEWDHPELWEQYCIDERDFAERKKLIEKSWKRRMSISNTGGSGWWSWEDESQVRWEHGRGGCASGDAAPSPDCQT